MENRIKGTLVDLGYDIKLLGAKYVEDVIYQMLGFLSSREEQEKISVENIEEIIKTSKSLEEMDARILKSRTDEMLARAYLEAYHFDLEVGAKLYFERINEFFESNDPRHKKSELYKSIFGKSNGDATLNDRVLSLVNHFNGDARNLLEEKKERDKEVCKKYILRFDDVKVAEK